MSAPTFLQVLKAEVARMQTLHPERLGEISRACALILHGQVLPSADDPQTGQVLSSDGEKHYSVNGTCSCQAGQHGKGCKHQQAWRLYQYVARKVAAVEPEAAPPVPLPEAPASCNVYVTISGHKVQVTLRDQDEGRMLARLAALLQQYPAPAPTARPEGWCQVHNTQMKETTKEGRTWWSHKTEQGWCKGRGGAK